MKVRVRPSLVLWLSVLFYLDRNILLPFLLAAGFHELGHVVALVAMDRPPESLSLGFSGAQIQTPPLSYRQELLAAAAGPGASMLLALFLPLWPLLGFYSVALGLVNLIPVPGLDGGRMLRCGLLLLMPEEYAVRICRFAAMLCALGLWGTAVYLAAPRGWGILPLIPAAIALYRAFTLNSDGSIC